MEDTTPPTPRRTAAAVVGAGLALPAVALVVVGASAERPPWRGDGAWTTPLEVVLAVVGLALLLALVVALRNLPGGVPAAERGSRTSRWWLVAGAAAVAALAWLAGVAPGEEGSGAAGDLDLDLPAGFGGENVPALPPTTTAVVGGLVFLGLVASLAAVLLSRHVARGRADTPDTPAEHDPAEPMDGLTLPAGPPTQVVLTAWAIARRDVVTWLDTGEHDPPGGLLRRVAGTPVAAPLRELTGLYLPVRYGRAAATEEDARAARAALDRLRERLAATGAAP